MTGEGYKEGRPVEGIDRMEQEFVVLSQDEPGEDLATLAATLGRLHFPGKHGHRPETVLDIAEPLGLPEVISQTPPGRCPGCSPPISRELAPIGLASRPGAGGEGPPLRASRPENRNEHAGLG